MMRRRSRFCSEFLRWVRSAGRCVTTMATRAAVAASRLAWRDGKIVSTSAGRAVTDDRGRYWLDRLRPGPYALCAEAGSSSPAPSFVEIADAGLHPEAHVYARTCYPAASPSPQSTFRMAAGQRREIDV